MKWTLVSSSSTLETFELSDKHNKLLTLDFHPLTNSARIIQDGVRRVFMIRREGFLRNRIVLRNEYGIRMGQMSVDRSAPPHTGTINQDNERLLFNLSTGDKPTLTISRNIPGSEQVSCSFDPRIQTALSGAMTASQQCLLMTFGWYLTRHTQAVSIEENSL